MHPFLTDPDNAKAYQLLCDQPRGSSRAWATKAGWTHSRMVRFIEALKAEGLCRVETLPRRGGSLFVPTVGVPKRSETFRSPDVVLDKSNSNNKVPRYAVTAADCIELIVAANRVLEQREWEPIPEDNRGSIAAATKILRDVPVKRAIALLEAAVRLFNPSATGGEQLRSLGHPFITKYVVNEFRRTERELAQGQLSLLFVERTGPPPQVFGARKPSEPEKPPATADSIAQGRAEFERIAAHGKIERL